MARNTSINARDRGLALISRLNRWMIAGAVGLAGLVSLIASQSFHGRTLSRATSQGASAASSTGSSSAASSSAGSIQQPSQAPAVATPVVPTAPVVSGGS